MKPLNVLSLFDGISCGRVALERAGIPVANYYASEIDKYTIKVSQSNYPDIIPLGDVRNIRGCDLPDIDLLIGGSPCQGFSFAGKQLNFEDPRSALFFEYVRLMNELKPKYFLLENVMMKKEYRDVISHHLNVSPVLIDSNLVSAQNRKRLYWTNIYNKSDLFHENTELKLPDNKNILLRDILLKDADKSFNLSDAAVAYMNRNRNGKPRWAYHVNDVNGKAACLAACFCKGAPYLVLRRGASTYDNPCRFLTPIECERLQTLPDNYTSCICKTQRYKALGNGWTVDVVAHIFKGLLVIE